MKSIMVIAFIKLMKAKKRKMRHNNTASYIVKINYRIERESKAEPRTTTRCTVFSEQLSKPLII